MRKIYVILASNVLLQVFQFGLTSRYATDGYVLAKLSEKINNVSESNRSLSRRIHELSALSRVRTEGLLPLRVNFLVPPRVAIKR